MSGGNYGIVTHQTYDIHGLVSFSHSALFVHLAFIDYAIP
ncbi:hypothetical protein PEC301296_17980 [Pectobacterium carotovorum subsp. carotovorum]|nr:hypothetical protein PEC301296_17980 [Pectobacterium carotovorum subsp. carotovorum]